MWEWLILCIKLVFFIPGKKTTGDDSSGIKTEGEKNDEVNESFRSSITVRVMGNEDRKNTPHLLLCCYMVKGSK